MAKSEITISIAEIGIKAQRFGLTMRPIGQRGAVFELSGGGTYYAETLEQAEAFLEGVRAGRSQAVADEQLLSA